MTKVFVTIVLTLFSCTAFSQSTTLLAGGLEHQIEIKYSSEAAGSVNAQMLALVSKTLGVSTQQSIIHYTVKEHQQIIKTGNMLNLSLAVGNYVLNDELSYLKFSINAFLTPSLISYTYVWEDANDTVLEKKTETDKAFKNGSFLLKSKVDDIYNDESYKLYLSELSFGFTANDVKKLDEYMAMVDAYYNSDAQLNMLEQTLDAIRIDSIELLTEAHQQTQEHLEVFSRIKSQRFTSKLDLNANDPIQFKSHLGRVEVRNKELKKELEFALNNMHLTYFAKGNQYLTWGNKETAAVYFKKSIAKKASFASPYVELALLDLEKKNYPAVLDTCKKVLLTLKTDTDARYKAVKASEAVIYAYIDEIYSSIEAQEFSSAMNRFEQIKTLAREIPGVKNFQEFAAIQDALYKAYYDNLVLKARASLDKRELMQAHRTIDSITAFRNEYPGVILNPSKEHELLRNLFDQWVARGKQQIENHQTDSALFSFMQAKVLCSRYEVVYCTEELELLVFESRKAQYANYLSEAEMAIEENLPDSALHLLSLAEQWLREYKVPESEQYPLLLAAASNLKYIALIREGNRSFENNRMHEALALYQEALTMEQVAGVKPDPGLPSRILETAKYLVLLQGTQTASLVEAMNLPDARIKLNQMRELSATYKLENDTEVAEAVANAEALLVAGKCDQALFDYNVQLTAAKKFIEQREFIYASQALEKANALTGKNADCNLDKSVYSTLRNDISAMLYYQKKKMQIDTYIDDKEYNDAIDAYEKLTRFYADSCTHNFGIEHLPIENYFLNHNQSMFIDFGVRYYVERGNLELGMNLLRELRHRDYIASWSKASQVDLGVKLALKDIEQNPERDPKIQVIEYTKADKWYRYLKKAYLMQWKNR
ncbi:MAG: hypothetical protein CVU09_00655 [Bacteroidetes bacterium HGW-Bacteroidetes-4]|jgi:hypothetical protein|nr:MAG: hypothetical protein CVU09_00655 [Bacteroidetes bacterium HGW-Bacteroidetes-4]